MSTGRKLNEVEASYSLLLLSVSLFPVATKLDVTVIMTLLALFEI